MKKFFSLLLLYCTVLCGAQAQDFPRYGYAPETCDSTDMVFQGIGENGFVSAYICLDPALDPAMARLKGHQILGVRCFMSNEYKQTRQKRSLIQCAKGSVEAEPVQKVCDFEKGWNNLYFDEPVTIGDEPLYGGLQVFETLGAGYPIGAYDAVSVAGGCWFNLQSQGWKEYTDRGVLMISAILDDEAAPLLERSVFAQTSHAPLVIAPASHFAGKVSFLNCSDKPVSSVVLHTQGQGDAEPEANEIHFDTPLQPHEARVLPMSIRSGAETGINQWLRLTVPTVDGEEAQTVMPGTTWHYVTSDAFVRVPLVEEFTSQTCTACPFMAYFLDIAMEEHTLSDLVYVTHHSGYQKDSFTQPVDDELLFLFGPGQATFNPAVMYDRVVPVGEEVPVVSAKVAETEPYASALAQAAVRPAMASVNLSLQETEEGIGCHISGRLNSDMAASGLPIYISAYLVEDSISLEKYPQKGLDGDGAPADLLDRFKHNGVIRHNYCATATGDQLVLDADNNYSVDFAPVALAADWNRKNCRVAAFVHLLDRQKMRYNEVLNAAQVRLNAEASAIGHVEAPETLRVFVGNDGRLHTSAPVRSLQTFDAAGNLLPAGSRLQPGVYIVRLTPRHAGATVTQKVVVR